MHRSVSPRTSVAVPTGVALAVTAAARAVAHPGSLRESLDAIARAARDTIPGFDHAGISVTRADGTQETVVGTDDIVFELDRLQHSLGEGPGVEAMTGEPVVAVTHAGSDHRWPRYLPRAAGAGLRSQLAMRIHTDRRTLGGLTLYSTSSDDVCDDAVPLGELFTAHAAVALERDRHHHELTEALGSRKVIGQAIGLVMQRYRLDEDRALDFLMRVSSTSNTKLRAVAEEIVASADAEFRPGAVRDGAGRAGGSPARR